MIVLILSGRNFTEESFVIVASINNIKIKRINQEETIPIADVK